MKKQLLKNTLVAIAALFIAIIALPTTAQAQELRILGKGYYEDIKTRRRQTELQLFGRKQLGL